MSIIQLGTITQLWQNVSDWATGVSSVKPKIQIDQTVQGITNGVSIVGSLTSQGDTLVKVPFKNMTFNSTTFGSASSSFQASGQMINSDQSGTALFCMVPAPSTGVQIRQAFYGRAFGLRVKRDVSVITNISVANDGVAYPPIVSQSAYFIAEAESPVDEGYYIVELNLPDGAHIAEITLTYDGNATNQTLLTGFMFERRAGYSESPPILQMVSATVPTSAGAIPTGTFPNNLKSVQKLVYYNGSASAIALVIMNGTNAMYAINVPATGYSEVNLTGLSTVTNLQHYCGVASTVMCTVIGGC